ncbi:MAG: nucleotidyltransferase domain-containing protein [Nitrospirae bacterium]|nr:nucleotidyltransferase domain-containing protein [Nitrospirota bacterium]
MALQAVLKEREKKLTILRNNAMKEAQRLAFLLSKRYKFEAIYLFGSLLSGKFRLHSDIDMVIKGLKVEDFFKAHAFLIKESRYRIDLKPFEDLEDSFKEKILRKGLKIG